MSETTAEITPTEAVETTAAPTTTTVAGTTAVESEQKIETVEETAAAGDGNAEMSATVAAGEASGEAPTKPDEPKADEGMEVDVSFVYLCKYIFKTKVLHLGTKG